MKRFVLALVIGVCCTLQPGWANPVMVDSIRVLPVYHDRVLLEFQSQKPIVAEYRFKNGYSHILLKDVQVNSRLYDAHNRLVSSAFIRRPLYNVVVEQTDTGAWLRFETRTALTVTMTFSEESFTEEVARHLPLYPQWPVAPDEGNNDIEHLVSNSYSAFESDNLAEATQALESLFNGMPEPPQALYELLGALYLKQEMWVKALCLYGQGAHQFPDSLALRYSGVLYQLNQPDKAIQVLKDVLITTDISTETLAHAQYMLGTLFIEKRDFEKAVAYLNASASTFSNDAVVLYNLAIAYEGARKYNLALETYQKALKSANTDLSSEIRPQIQRLKNKLGVEYTDTPSKG